MWCRHSIECWLRTERMLTAARLRIAWRGRAAGVTPRMWGRRPQTHVVLLTGLKPDSRRPSSARKKGEYDTQGSQVITDLSTN